MKKIIIIATLIAFGTLTAQTEKGTFLISGRSGINFASKQINIEADSQQSNNSKINSFSITPSFAYFVVNNFALGLSLDYTYLKNRQQSRYPLSYLYDVTNTNTFQTSEVKTINSTFSIMPSATYFFSKGKAKPYIGAGLGYANNNNEYSVTGNNDSGAYSYSKGKICWF
jgi:outer membrane protein